MKTEDIKQYFPWEFYRDNQEGTIKQILDAFDEGYKIVVLKAPVGFGKSAVGITLGKILESTYYTTPQKMLQDQLGKDFTGKDFAVVKGRNNFKCQNSKQMCDCGVCKLKRIKSKKRI